MTVTISKMSAGRGCDDSQVSQSWPYHLAHLRGRLGKGGQRDRLHRMATSLSRTQSCMR